MNKLIEKTPFGSFATISDDTLPVISAVISADIQQDHSLEDQITAELYGEALLSGTKTKNREVFLDSVNALGASVSITSSQGTVRMVVKSQTKTFKKVLDLVEEMLTEPLFSQAELRRNCTLTKNHLNSQKDNARYLASHHLQAACFGTKDRRHSATLSKLESALAQVTTRSLKEFHKRVQTAKWNVAIAGPLSSQKLLASFAERIKTKTVATSTPLVDIKPSPTQAIFTPVPSSQNLEFEIGKALALNVTDDDYVPFAFGIKVLGSGGFVSRLMNNVREKEGLTYNIQAKLTNFYTEGTGMLHVQTFFSPHQSEQGLRSTFREISLMHKKGITENEYSTFKTIIDTSHTLKQDSPFQQLAELHAFQLLGFDIASMQEHFSRFHLVTRSQINDALAAYLSPDSFTISAAGPIKTVKKDLTDFLKTV